MKSLELRNLTKRYGTVTAVDSVNFSCNSGEFIALLGPSGCGKSSTMRMIAGLEAVTDGEIRFGGTRVDTLPPRDRNVALAFESYALYSPLTVRENLAFPLTGRLPNDEIRRRVASMAERFDLEELLDRKPGGLSGGQSQRVSLARALIREPKVLLLDEPLSHLDHRLRTVIRARIRNIHDSLPGTTTIYVTHDQEEAIALADRIIVMNDTRFQQIGPVEELWNTPRNMFVGGFLGDPPMNFLPAQAVGDQIDLGGGARLEFPDGWSRAPQLTVGVRPDWLDIVSVDAVETVLHARVLVVEFQGDRSIVTVTGEAGEIKVIVDPAIPCRRGDAVGIAFKPGRLALFNAETGQSLHEELPPVLARAI
jgi:multiple sugar transport system ATP-binding protein